MAELHRRGLVLQQSWRKLSCGLPCLQGAPVYDYASSALTLNITLISDPGALKFQDGIARQTYQNAVTPNKFARVRPASSCTSFFMDDLPMAHAPQADASMGKLCSVSCCHCPWFSLA